VLESEFEAHRGFLWSLCYRLTGNAHDADDVVQETFVRAIERPPRRSDAPWRPWLVRVALNLGRDLLRRRRRRRYEGPWLPSPIETGGDPTPIPEPSADPAAGPGARYDLLESVTFAFLLALEALSPAQRAVLLLRDVFDYSVRETASALGLSEANVKTTHLRARRAMAAYDRDPRPPTRTLADRTQKALERFLTCLASGDAAGAEALLAADVRALSDGGGEFAAARLPILGRERVARLYLALSQKVGPAIRVELRTLNGLPAVLLENATAPSGWARRSVVLCDVGADGRILNLYTVVASGKLTALRP
jgi:RNA polymerase sigma-70 factor (ECF subfamily)